MRLLGSRAIYLINNSPFLKRQFIKNTCCYYSNEGKTSQDKHLLFFDEKVQDILKKLTEKDVEKIYKKKKFGEKPQTPEYKFMTDKELEEVIKEAENRAEEKLQMPPILPARKEIDHVFLTDSKLKAYSESKFVFTDITYGKNDRNRIIVVREPDGSLRKANWEERSRMNEIYFPRPGRKLWMPAMFEPELLKDLLARKEYLFTLDRACIQFEPDDPEYVRVISAVYDQINEELEFNLLRSTRHYGSLVFYLIAIRNNIDNLLLENLETDRLKEGTWAIDLFNIINPEKKCNHKYVKGEELNYIKAFIDQCAVNKGKLELAHNKYKNLLKSPKVQAQAI